jgi:hypothetical protein
MDVPITLSRDDTPYNSIRVNPTPGSDARPQFSLTRDPTEFDRTSDTSEAPPYRGDGHRSSGAPSGEEPRLHRPNHDAPPPPRLTLENYGINILSGKPDDRKPESAELDGNTRVTLEDVPPSSPPREDASRSWSAPRSPTASEAGYRTASPYAPRQSYGGNDEWGASAGGGGAGGGDGGGSAWGGEARRGSSQDGAFPQHAAARGDGRDYDNRSEASDIQKTMSQQEIDRLKRELLRQFERLELRGQYKGKHFGMSSTLEEMQHEYAHVKEQIDADKAIKFYSSILRTVVNGGELLNQTFRPVKALNLDGWSDNYEKSADDVDDVLYELHQKYHAKVHIPPEIKLVMMFGGSALMTALGNAVGGSLGLNSDVLKDNPDLVRELQTAGLKNASSNPAMGGIFSMMNAFGANMPTPSGQGADMLHELTKNSDMPLGKGGGPPVQRSEMTGPSNMDDLLSAFAPTPAPAAPARPASASQGLGQRAEVFQPPRARSVNLSELTPGDLDRVSEISSMDARDEPNAFGRPSTGARDAFALRIRERRGKRSKQPPSGGLVIDV